MIVVGSMIGSGIFIVSADIAHQVQSPGLLLLVWLASGVMTLIGALSFGELAAAMPHAGGQYVYLRESSGQRLGISLRLDDAAGHPDSHNRRRRHRVCQVHKRDRAVVFGFAMDWRDGTFGPWRLWFGELGPYNVGLNRQNLLAILSIVFLTWINTRGLRLGKIVQNVFTVTKIVSLAGLVLLGLVVFDSRRPRRELHGFLAQCRLVRDASLPARQFNMDDRHADAGGCGDGRLAFRHGRVEQRHVHGRRGEELRAAICRFRSRSGPGS